MQFILLVVALTVLALATAEVATQGKKAKVVSKSAKSGNSYLNVWFYGDSTCSGPVGLSASIINGACSSITCQAQRRALAKKDGSSKRSAASVLAEILPKVNSAAAAGAAAAARKLQSFSPLSNQVNFNSNTFGDEEVATIVSSGYNDTSCSVWSHNDATGEFEAFGGSGGIQSTALPVNDCILGATGYPFKITLSAEPMIPDYANGHIAVGAFETSAQCSSSPYGSDVSTEKGFQMYLRYPIDACSFNGEVTYVESSSIKYRDYTAKNCTGAYQNVTAPAVGVCVQGDVGGVTSDSLTGCEYQRADIVPVGKTAKGNKSAKGKKASSLRM